VKREEFKVPGGEGNLAETFFNPEREGWLTKEGGKYKSKHRRWFILKESILYYFKQPTVSCDYCLQVFFSLVVESQARCMSVHAGFKTKEVECELVVATNHH